MLLVDAEPIMVDSRRVGMDVGKVELRFFSRCDLALEAVASDRVQTAQLGVGRIPQGSSGGGAGQCATWVRGRRTRGCQIGRGVQSQTGRGGDQVADRRGGRSVGSAAEAAAPTPVVQPVAADPASRGPPSVSAPGS